MDTYKRNADRQVMGLKTETKPELVNINDILHKQKEIEDRINYNIIPYPLDRLPQQISELYIHILDIKAELKRAVLNNPVARKKIKTLNIIDDNLDDIASIIINKIVKQLDFL